MADTIDFAPCFNPECTGSHPTMFTNPDNHKLWQYRVECFLGCNAAGPGAETREEAARLWAVCSRQSAGNDG